MTNATPTALAHHTWANLQLLDVCAGLRHDQLAASVEGTMGSIIATLRHIVGADAAYLELLTDGGVLSIDEDAMDVAALRRVAQDHVDEFAQLAAEDRSPDEVVTRHNSVGDSRAPLAVRMAQVAHHGAEHRSQVCTILTQLGIDPPEIDVWAWAEANDLLTWEPRQS